jgi:hypothetical protein
MVEVLALGFRRVYMVVGWWLLLIGWLRLLRARRDAERLRGIRQKNKQCEKPKPVCREGRKKAKLKGLRQTMKRIHEGMRGAERDVTGCDTED